MNKDIYIADLQNRFAGYTFVETTNQSLVEVVFRDAGSNPVARSVAQSVDVVVNAYRQIRRQMLQSARPLFMLTAAQRDALSGVDSGLIIDNITSNTVEVFGGSEWISAGGAVAPPAYGDMVEDNLSGSEISNAATYKGWITASAGIFDGNGLITFLSNGTADRLVVGTGGAGDYMTSFDASFTNSGGKNTTGSVFVNDVMDDGLMAEVEGDSGKKRILAKTGYLTLADDDYVDLRFISESNDDITIYQTEMTLHRLS